MADNFYNKSKCYWCDKVIDLKNIYRDCFECGFCSEECIKKYNEHKNKQYNSKNWVKRKPSMGTQRD